MVKAVIFDCFGVLTTDTWRLFLSGLPREADIETARQVHRQYNAGLITKQDCSERIKAATGSSFIEVEDAVDQTMAKNAPLLDYINELHDRGFKTAILSNVGSNWIRDTLLSAAEQKFFDEFIFSYQVQLLKPDPQMYQLTCDRLGVEPAEALFVDDKEPYCQAARAIGMQAVCYQDFAQIHDDLERMLV